MKKASVYLRMARPAGMVAAMADVLAGTAIAGRFESGLNKTFINILLLCVSTALLYAGSAIFHDVFNAKQHAIDDPKRAIPSGMVTSGQATFAGCLLFVVGIGLSLLGSDFGGYITLGITIFALLYVKWGKNIVIGPLYLGICHGLNLILGISLVPFEMHAWWFLALIPVVYVYAVALIGHAKSSKHVKQDLQIGALLYVAALGAILYQANTNGELEVAGVCLIVFAILIFIPLSNAIKHPVIVNIAKAAKAGTQYLICIDVALAVTFDSWLAAFVITGLAFVCIWLAKVYKPA